MKRRMNIPCLFETSNLNNTSSLIPVELILMHDNDNRNQTHISLDTIKKYEQSIKNKPILAYLRKDEDGSYDFAGHEMEFEWSEKDRDFKLRYLEYPVGIIPESTEISYFTKNDKTYLKCTGYIYREYSNETVEIIKNSNGKCVSVELDVNDTSLRDNGFIEITNFEFLGVTILSDSLTPGMDETCRISFIENTINKRFVADYHSFIEKANKDILKFEELDANKENEEIQDLINENSKEINSESISVMDEKENKDIEFDYKPFIELFEKDINNSNELLSLFVETINEKQKLIDDLLKFKKEYEEKILNNEVENISNKFNFDEDDISELKEKVYTGEINLDEFENSLYIELGKKALKKNFNKSTKVSEIMLFDSDKNTSTLYGGILDKFKITEVM